QAVSEAPKAQSKPAKLSYKQEKALAAAEQQVADLESRLAALEAALADPDTHQDAGRSQAVSADYQAVKDALEEAEMTWLTLAEEAGA
ncbi:MAG: ABC transporter C-terminal domain-containing protein, partial [Candidatus Sericytochromatia bacterium]